MKETTTTKMATRMATRMATKKNKHSTTNAHVAVAMITTAIITINHNDNIIRYLRYSF